jgi:hypothetical protein
MKVFLGICPEINGINHIVDKPGKMILRQPLSDIRRKLQWLDRLLRYEAAVSHSIRSYRAPRRM